MSKPSAAAMRAAEKWRECADGYSINEDKDGIIRAHARVIDAVFAPLVEAARKVVEAPEPEYPSENMVLNEWPKIEACLALQAALSRLDTPEGK